MATEPDFDLQMKSLAEEAQQFLDADRPGKRSDLLEFLRPLVQHIESLGRAITENTMAVMRIEETVLAQSNITMLPRLITTLHEDLENRNGVNQKLFDAMHEELKGYKDGFLLEVLHRPLIRDLITLYDDLAELHRRTAAFLAGFAPGVETPEVAAARNQLRTLSTNLDHIVESLIEILARMDVRRAEASSGKLDKIAHRAMKFEPAATPGDDQTIAASLKPGFLWRERTFRPEEVAVRKWRPENPAPSGDPSSQR
ncbi:MAG TPA: nucleotide exchange factor GrpE [Chthoniobacteraceae bacterium]|jgi:hypothetical protein|nr:nucleotide exchange factor GrpE [Chthoniobacteraceae bacterium]